MINTNHIRKLVSWALLLLALWFFTPPGLPPDDIVNFVVGDYLSTAFQISLEAGILLTYTVVPLAILYISCMVNPKPTNQVWNSSLAMIKKLIMKFINNPKLLVTGIIVAIILYYTYVLYIAEWLGI